MPRVTGETVAEARPATAGLGGLQTQTGDARVWEAKQGKHWQGCNGRHKTRPGGKGDGAQPQP